MSGRREQTRRARRSARGVRAAAAVVVVAMVVGCAPGAEVALDETRIVSGATEVGTAPMFAVSPDGEEAIAWISAPEGGTDGRLYVTVGDRPPVELRDTLGPIEAHGESPPKLSYGRDGALNAIYVVSKVVPGRRFPVSALRFVRSADGGRTWSEPATVTDDEVFASHNFHSLHAAVDGAIYVSWLDGRDGRSAAYVTRSLDDGRTWEPNRRVDAGEACPCCRTSLASAVDGTLYLAWRAVLPGSVRDIVVARSTDGGMTWSAPVRAHADDWVFDGCPHAGPSLQVDGEGRVHIAWWTGREGSAGVHYARSDDGARTFNPPVPLGVARHSQPAHVQLAVDHAGRVAAAWDDGTVRVPRVVMRVSRDGGATFGDVVALSDEGQVAGYPVLAIADEAITVAWSERTPEAAERAAKAAPDMRDPTAVKGLTPVGAADVVVRTGRLR